MTDYGNNVPRIAIMGGIGSGKTAVTDYLARRGAFVVDADEVARDVVRPGEPAWQALRDAFGDAILQPDRTLDRAFVAEIVFHDPTALRRLNHITHTAIGLEMAAAISSRPASEVVAVALPLFRPVHRTLFALDEVWCVHVDPAVARRRLIESRGFRPADADARLAAQPSNEERLALADRSFANDGSLDDLHAQVARVLAQEGLLGG